MKKTRLTATKLEAAPLKLQTTTMFKFDGGVSELYSTTNPTTTTVQTFTTGIARPEIAPAIYFNKIMLDI